jgi:hypothetical protein
MLAENNSLVQDLIGLPLYWLWSRRSTRYLELLSDTSCSVGFIKCLIDWIGASNFTFPLWWKVLMLIPAHHQASLSEHLHHHSLSIRKIGLEMSVLITSSVVIQGLRKWNHCRVILTPFSLPLLGGRFVSNICLWRRLDHDIMGTARVCPWCRTVWSVYIVDNTLLIIILTSRYHYINSGWNHCLVFGFR